MKHKTEPQKPIKNTLCRAALERELLTMPARLVRPLRKSVMSYLPISDTKFGTMFK